MKSPRPKRLWTAFLKDTPDSFSKRKKRFFLSLFAALLLNVFFLVALPFLWKSLPEPRLQDPKEEFQIEFDSSEMQFVEANPDVDIKEPVDTNNYSSQSQVAAQAKKATQPINEEPATDGEMAESHKIVDGDMAEPEPEPELIASQDPPQPEQAPSQAQPESTPEDEKPPEPKLALDPFFKDVIEDQEGEGSIFQNEHKDVELAENEEVKEVVEQPVVEPKPDSKPTPQQQASRPAPRPRPKLKRKPIPGPVRRTQGAASNLGNIAVNSRFSEFGDYQQRMMESITYQWHLLGGQASISSADIGSMITVRFTIDRDGNVDNLYIVHSSGSPIAEVICKDAIESRSPFGVWSKDMVHSLGDEQPMQINFYYW